MVQFWPKFTSWRWVKSKNSQLAIQIIQNQSPIFFQLSVKTIITSCSVWAFFGYNWVMGPGSKIKRLHLRLATLFQKPLVIVSSHFLTLDLFLYATPKGWKESIAFPDTERYAKSFEKNSLKKSNIREARLALTGDLTQKERFLKPIEKKSLYRVSNYSTILVITKIYIFLLHYFTLVLLLITRS